MNYFVVLPDGQRYGPADLNLLNQWVAEGRILSNTMIEEAATGRRFTADSLPGLSVQTQTSFHSPPMHSGTVNPPQPYANYYRAGPQMVVDNGQSDLTLAYVFASIGLVTCLGGGVCGGCSLIGLVFPILGVVYAKKAEDKGHPSANSAKILAWVALALQIAGTILGLIFFGIGMMGGWN